MQKIWVQSLGHVDPLEKEMATHSSILAWRIPRTEEPVGYSPWVAELDTTEQLTLSLFRTRCCQEVFDLSNQMSFYHLIKSIHKNTHIVYCFHLALHKEMQWGMEKSSLNNNLRARNTKYLLK